VFAGLTPSTMGESLKALAAKVRLSTLLQAPPWLEASATEEGEWAKISHVSTANCCGTDKASYSTFRGMEGGLVRSFAPPRLAERG